MLFSQMNLQSRADNVRSYSITAYHVFLYHIFMHGIYFIEHILIGSAAIFLLFYIYFDMPLRHQLLFLDILYNGLYYYLWLCVDSCFILENIRQYNTTTTITTKTRHIGLNHNYNIKLYILALNKGCYFAQIEHCSRILRCRIVFCDFVDRYDIDFDINTPSNHGG